MSERKQIQLVLLRVSFQVCSCLVRTGFLSTVLTILIYGQLGPGLGHGGTPADGSSSELGQYTGTNSNILNAQFMACNLLVVTVTTQEKKEQ